jgi:hypothetical protein
MVARRSLLAVLALALFASPAHATPLVFSQDTFLFRDGESFFPLTVELFGINEATSSFRLTASGTIVNEVWDYLEPGDAITYFPFVSFYVWDMPDYENSVVTVVDWSIPEGPGVFPDGDGYHCLANGVGVYASGNYMCAGFPTLPDPFDWSVTLEITVPELIGDYHGYSTAGQDAAWYRPDATWEILGGDPVTEDDFVFSIQPIPEPSTALLLAAGIVSLAIRARRA